MKDLSLARGEDNPVAPARPNQRSGRKLHHHPSLGQVSDAMEDTPGRQQCWKAPDFRAFLVPVHRGRALRLSGAPFRRASPIMPPSRKRLEKIPSIVAFVLLDLAPKRGHRPDRETLQRPQNRNPVFLPDFVNPIHATAERLSREDAVRMGGKYRLQLSLHYTRPFTHVTREQGA